MGARLVHALALGVSVLIVIALTATGTARAADALSVLGKGASSRVVSLTVQADNSLTGKTNIVLSNEASKRVRVTARFFADDSAEGVEVGPTTSPLAMARPVTIATDGTAVLALTAALPSDTPPSDLDGTLLLRAREARTVVGSVEVGLTGALALPTDVAFEPSSVTLQVTQGQDFFNTTGGSQTIRVRGAGVARLIVTIGELTGRKAAGQLPTVLLGSDSGKQALVELRNLHEVAPGLAEVTVSTNAGGNCPNARTCNTAAPSAGTYTGALSLTPGTDGGPTLNVTVNSRWWFGFPLLLVLAGAVVGGLLPMLTANARVKRALRAQLRQSLGRYKRMRPDTTTTPAAWNIDKEVGPEPWYPERLKALKDAEGRPAPWTSAGDGVAALWLRIRQDISDADLKADATAAADLVRQVDDWVAAETLAEDLAELKKHPPADRKLHRWDATKVKADTDNLLNEVAAIAPPSHDDAVKWCERLSRQLKLHKMFARAWKLKAEEEAPLPHPEQTTRLDVIDTELRGDNPNVIGLTAELEGLATSYEENLASASQPVLPSGDAGQTQPSDLVAHESGQQGAESRQASVTTTSAGSSMGGAAETAKRTRRFSPRMPAFISDTLNAADVLLSIVIAAGTAVAYVLPLYTSTWGSWENFVLAGASGVAGQVVIKWTLLPALSSRRSATASTS